MRNFGRNAWIPELIFLIGSSTPLFAADAPPINFDRQIRPILSNNCFACHGPDEAERQADLRLDIPEGLLGHEPGEGAVVPGKPEESRLFERISSSDESLRMPPADSAKKLTPEQIELIRTWIAQGAQWQQHWSFIPPTRPEPPPASRPDWIKNPIDNFILARLDKEGLAPSPEASKETLIRRVTFDLTGLPPTLKEIDAFLADNSPEAYEKLVDRLLDSPRYGEHAARYWLDAARYGDTHGLHLDNQRSIWPYRDWVIKAYNDNKPFDQFTIEQLAGDLLPNPTRDQLVATGFNRCNVTTSEGGAIPEEWKVRYAVDRVDTTATVWMGLTLGCAVCHDHKFDPFTQKDFYQLFAYFNNLTENPMDGNALLPPPIVKLPSPEQTEQLAAYDQTIAQTEQQIAAELAKIQYAEPDPVEGQTADESKSQRAWEEVQRKAEKPTAPKDVLAAIKVDPASRTPQQQQVIRSYYVQHVWEGGRPIFEPLNKQLADAKKERAELDAAIPATLIMEDRKEPTETFILIRGEYDKPGEKVSPGTPAVLPALPSDAPPNRLALARWLVDPSHPLTARVSVNRYWQRYFGTGLVKTAEDFGSQGERPSHPELLDWLATEFIASGWDIKHMQKLIVMSATYRQSSRVTPELFARDPENRLLARGPRFRLDAEMIRDNALAISGLLVEKIGGPSVKPYQPPGLWEAVGYTTSNTAKFQRDTGPALYRRGLYTFWKRTAAPPAMLIFDAPSREACTLVRARTNTPLQALLLMNDEQFVEAARHFARRILTEGGTSSEDRIRYAFRLATGRLPNDNELHVLLSVYNKHLADYRKNPEAALALLSVGESKRDENLDPHEHAAWTMVANLILNLDETMTKG